MVRQVFPDAIESDDQMGVAAHKSVTLNHLFGDYTKRVYEGEMSILGASALRIKNDGEALTLLLLEVTGKDSELFQWGGMSVLALFSTGRGIKLLDAVDVQADRFTFFNESEPVLRIHPNRDAALIVNHHFNSGDSYLAYTLIAVVDHRLKDVFKQMPLLVGDNHCGTNFTETPEFKLLRQTINGYRALNLRIKLLLKRDDPACERPSGGFTRYFNYVLVWQPELQSYKSASDATRRLRRADRALGFEF